MSWRVEEYEREDGSIPFREWLNRLDPQVTAKVGFATMRLAQGNTSKVKWIVLLGGGTKRRQQIDIDRAKALLAEYKARKARGGSTTDR